MTMTIKMATSGTTMAATTALCVKLAPPFGPRQDIGAPMIVKRIISLAIILTLSVSSHTSSCVRAFTFTPPVVHVAYPSGAKSSSSSMSPTQLFVLQPSKGGIIVEAKSDFVARDILIDGFMGRDSSGSGEKELGWKEPQQDLDFNDNFAPNESSWVQSPNSRRMGQQVQQQQQSQFQSASMPVPPPMPPQPIIMQPQQRPPTPSSTTNQSTLINTSGAAKSKLPDPSLMKLSDIQGELSLRRIDYNDCFDRTSLEARLREARLAMMKPTTTTSTAKPQFSTPRSSPAEQAIFSSSFASTRTASSATPSASASSRVAATSNSASSSPPLSNGNPFRRQSATKNSNNNRGGLNSSSSFRDNSHGIGFGDANSYYSSVGPRGGGNVNSGGDGVRLGKQRTSYGEFGNDIVGGNVYSGSSAAGVGAAGGSSQGVVGNSHRNNFNSRGDGGSSSRGTSIGSSSLSGGGSTSIFNSGASGGGGTTSTFSNFGSNGNSASFSAGGMSVKGDSSIFSSVGFIGQQGTVTNVFSEKGGGRSTSGGSGATSRNMGVSAGGVAERPSGLRGGVGESPLRSPVPPSEEPRLDWLRQEPPQNEHDWMDSPAATDYDATRSYYTNVLNDNALPTSYKSNWISQQYQEQGLDYLSGGLEGFGAIKGVETSGGESRNRARADNIPQPGVAGNTGVTMGGDFSSFGAVGDGQRRSSARYNSGGGDDGFDDNDFVD